MRENIIEDTPHHINADKLDKTNKDKNMQTKETDSNTKNETV